MFGTFDRPKGMIRGEVSGTVVYLAIFVLTPWVIVCKFLQEIERLKNNSFIHNDKLLLAIWFLTCGIPAAIYIFRLWYFRAKTLVVTQDYVELRGDNGFLQRAAFSDIRGLKYSRADRGPYNVYLLLKDRRLFRTYLLIPHWYQHAEELLAYLELIGVRISRNI